MRPLLGSFEIALGSYLERDQLPILETLFESFTRIGVQYLQTHPLAPNLYTSGVVYVREGAPEFWRDIPTIIRDGEDDCEGLSSWLAAELRVRRGVPAAYVALERQPSGRVIHAVVKDPVTGTRWDPSKTLGMRPASNRQNAKLPPLTPEYRATRARFERAARQLRARRTG